MKILGISGLDNSVRFKKARFPDLQPHEYRVAQGFDSAAVLLDGAEVVFAASEERFTREKATGDFPVRSIKAALAAGHISPADVDFVAHGFDYAPYKEFFQGQEYNRDQFDEVYDPSLQIKLFGEHFPDVDWKSKFVPVQHHVAHAASAFYQSGYESSLVLVSDGMGEVDSMTVLSGTPEGLEILAKVPAMHSLGQLYSAFTMYTGFEMNMDEYKIMGLAPFGNRRKYFNEVMSLIKLKDDGTYAIPLFAENKTVLAKETHAGVLSWLEERFGPRRAQGAEGMDDRFKDLSAALQAALQQTQLHVLKHYRRETGLENLCMAGGVALNCTANGVIKRSGLFKGIFVQPASGDDGSALGAALYVQRREQPKTPQKRIDPPLWGPGFDDGQIKAAVDARSAEYQVKLHDSFEGAIADAAERLDKGEILSWFRGRMEFGPRALGARSILADPRPEDMRNRVNMKIKKREGFRPFAPAVISEEAAEYFELKKGDEATYEHMLYVMQVRAKWRNKLHAITHVDGSARVQTVTEEGNAPFYAMLKAFGERTGISMLLNTSFNVKGQPIVCTPEEAIDTFLFAQLDALVIGNYVLSRND
ncbi:MAG: hypothetical protein OXT09_32785 [Myxococcales bacterium]|nr:hypothetical protein [Myxococcales bacterium]